VSAETLLSASPAYHHVVLATGITPRTPSIPGIDHPNVRVYTEVLQGLGAPVGKRVAIIGAGGIGFDVAEFLTHETHPPAPEGEIPPGPPLGTFLAEWGIDPTNEARGGLAPAGPAPPPPERQVSLLQRTRGKVGQALGKTTGWIHRQGLKARNVEFVAGVSYKSIDERGVTITVGGGKAKKGKEAAPAEERLIPADTIVICAGQEPNRELHADLLAAGTVQVHLIGGAEKAGELDAKRAIDQGSRLAAVIEGSKSGQVFEAPLSLGAHVYKAVASRMAAS
jgi:2,4-dienoyl-CoA reductase (NADPH2)